MGRKKVTEGKKARFILLLTQVALWFIVMVLELVVFVIDGIGISEYMFFWVFLDLVIIITILTNINNYRKSQ
ncbi:hypothetical protein B5F98_06510 [Pseudoflavonifractor sp. An44]|nr:hypothetical protein B5F98_06510 [Pseudoflavonifractor sp. An44]OUP40159.1 hypothetical protein B5F22_11525 [Pseudoflavonifractor sp. An187]